MCTHMKRNYIYTFTGANSSSRVTSTLELGLGVMKLVLGLAGLHQSPNVQCPKTKENSNTKVYRLRDDDGNNMVLG